MARWEYTVVRSENDLSAQLHQLGTEGWELVAVNTKREHIPRAFFGDEDKDIDFEIAYLKREVAATQ